MGDFVTGMVDFCLHAQQRPGMEVSHWWSMARTSYHGKQSVL